jgi:hypothetical protein
MLPPSLRITDERRARSTRLGAEGDYPEFTYEKTIKEFI